MAGVVGDRDAAGAPRLRGPGAGLGERTAQAESELATAQERTAQLEATVSALTTERAGLLVERYELRQAHERGNTAYGRLEGDLARARADHAAAVEALTQQRDRLSSAERATAEAAVRANDYQALLGQRRRIGHGDGCARGDLGHPPRHPGPPLGRRRRGAPDDRGVRSGTVAEQLEEALGREGERLREEVGVDVEVAAPALRWSRGDPVTFLLAATDVLGVLAAVCERVTIELDGGRGAHGRGLVRARPTSWTWPAGGRWRRVSPPTTWQSTTRTRA